VIKSTIYFTTHMHVARQIVAYYWGRSAYIH
jgi:hypothetical protein